MVSENQEVGIVRENVEYFKLCAICLWYRPAWYVVLHLRCFQSDVPASHIDSYGRTTTHPGYTDPLNPANTTKLPLIQATLILQTQQSQQSYHSSRLHWSSKPCKHNKVTTHPGYTDPLNLAITTKLSLIQATLIL